MFLLELPKTLVSSLHFLIRPLFFGNLPLLRRVQLMDHFPLNTQLANCPPDLKVNALEGTPTARVFAQ